MLVGAFCLRATIAPANMYSGGAKILIENDFMRNENKDGMEANNNFILSLSFPRPLLANLNLK